MLESMEITRRLCEFVAASRDTALSHAVGAATRRAFLNWFGCALGAADDESVEVVLRVAMELGGHPQASVIGRREQLDVVNAALVNGVAANALDFDDMHVATLIHPTGAVVAAALALAEQRNASGRILLNAIAVGIEIECRLGAALFPAHYDAGWHSTATLGTLGATAAASCVLGLPTDRIQHAFGIAATQASGLRAMLPNACKSYNVGHAAANGVRAVLLAEAGLQSAPDVLEATYGLFHVFGRPQHPEVLFTDLGSRYAVTEVSFKPYPCGVVIHPLIDAVLDLVRARKIDADRVVKMEAAVHPRAIQLAGRRHPADAIGGRFSLYHAAALALVCGEAGLAAFDGADVHAPRFVDVRGRMEVMADDTLSPAQARLRVQLADGTAVAHRVDAPSGSPSRPLSDDQMSQKFIELACRTVTPERAQRLYAECARMQVMDDVAALRRCWIESQGESACASR